MPEFYCRGLYSRANAPMDDRGLGTLEPTYAKSTIARRIVTLCGQP